MPLLINVETATGAQRRLGTAASPPPDCDPDETRVTLPAFDAEPSLATHVWDAALLDYVVRPSAAVGTTLTVLEFKGRFTQTERDLIEIATEEHPDRLVRSRLRMVEKDMESAKDKMLDRADPRVQMGIGLLGSITFEGAPLLTQARVVEIIGADALGG